MSVRNRTNDRNAVLAIFILSGAAGLIYEVVWARQLVLVFGNTTQAVATILTGFFAGMAIGSVLGGRLADRVPVAASPLRADRARSWSASSWRRLWLSPRFTNLSLGLWLAGDGARRAHIDPIRARASRAGAGDDPHGQHVADALCGFSPADADELGRCLR